MERMLSPATIMVRFLCGHLSGNILLRCVILAATSGVSKQIAHVIKIMRPQHNHILPTDPGIPACPAPALQHGSNQPFIEQELILKLLV